MIEVHVKDLSRSLKVDPITPICGAEVSSIDISRPVDDETIASLEDLLYRHKVLVLRNQHDAGPAELARFAERFGRPESEPHPSEPDFPGIPAVKVIKHDGRSFRQDTWHTDGATRENTRWISFLQAVDIPDCGRDTVYADMEAIYESLSPSFQEFLTRHDAWHSWGFQRPDAPPLSHPITVDNPVTGRKALYVNKGYTRSIDQLDPRESDLILQFLYQLVYIPEYHVRVTWKPGTIVIWDNQRTQHYIMQDSAYARVMHRVMIVTD